MLMLVFLKIVWGAIFSMFTGGLTASNQNISLYLPIILIDGKPAADGELVHGLVSQIIHYDLK